MTKVLLIGNSPLPDELDSVRLAPGLRTYHIYQSLIRKGHKVKLVTIELSDRKNKIDKDNDIYRFQAKDFSLVRKIQKIHNEYKPDCIISVNTGPSFVATKIKSNVPRWADLNGWIVSEEQMKAEVADNDAYLWVYIKRQKKILKWADVFSTVSERQMYATIGELAHIGRLRKNTNNHRFVYTIRNAHEKLNSDNLPFARIDGLKDIPKDHIIIGRMSYFAPWEDAISLAKIIREILAKYNNVHFVTTGGYALSDHTSFGKFCKALTGLKNVHFLGWLPTKDIVNFVKSLDIYVMTDKKCNETTFGARNRITDAAFYGIPCICTDGTEIVKEMSKKNAILSVESGSISQFVEKIEYLINNKEERIKIGKNAIDFIERFANFDITTLDLIEWVNNPIKAPDRKSLPLFFSVFYTPILYMKEKGIKNWFKKIIYQLLGK